MIKLFFNLNSPYKWGKGWTGTQEEDDAMTRIGLLIISKLGYTRIENIWNVPQGEKGLCSCYLHPMEYVFEVENYCEIEPIINFVEEISEANKHLFTIENKWVKNLETNESQTL